MHLYRPVKSIWFCVTFFKIHFIAFLKAALLEPLTDLFVVSTMFKSKDIKYFVG